MLLSCLRHEHKQERAITVKDMIGSQGGVLELSPRASRVISADRRS